MEQPEDPRVGRDLRTVKVPVAFEPLFLRAQDYVARYFRDLQSDPEHGTLSISGERYILLRAASMSVEFFDLVMSLYQDKGPDEAQKVASNLLFDVAHAIGKADARSFHERMGVTDPIERLSAGPVHFSYAGWAFVDISEESRPSPDDDFFLVYDHPYSFESDTWLRKGRTSPQPVCVMNSGYSSGWCEESFGLPLVAVEVSCLAAGGEHCRFVMAPPARIEQHMARFLPAAAARAAPQARNAPQVSVPEFFQRKRMEEQLQRSHETLERRVAERTAELVRTNDLLRKEIAERRRAEEMRDEFLSVASHELKTPLTSLRGFTQLVTAQIEQRGLPDPATLRTALGAIGRQTNKLTLLVDQLLDISRLEAGHLVLDRSPTDLMDLARHAAEAARASTRRHSVRLLGPPTLSAAVDALRLEQVLTNLLDNAIKYSPDGGPVEIQLEDTGSAFRLAVTDRGIGIPEEHRPRIFDRYYQAHSERRLGGMGLGLYISHQIVELHGGTLSLESPVGGGTCFVVSLPRNPSESSAR